MDITIATLTVLASVFFSFSGQWMRASGNRHQKDA